MAKITRTTEMEVSVSRGIPKLHLMDLRELLAEVKGYGADAIVSFERDEVESGGMRIRIVDNPPEQS